MLMLFTISFAQPNGSTIDLTGSWSGIWEAGGIGGELSVNFIQEESTLTGEATITNSICTTVETISGVKKRSTIVFGTTSGGSNGSSFNGSVDQHGDTIRAQFVVTAGRCAGSAGIWSLVRD
jgi:hypothetical protein